MTDPFSIPDLIDTWHKMPFEPFREGVDIHHIQTGEPALAILRYAPGARVPLHQHMGLETIFVLEGSQSDERGCYEQGALIVNPEGSVHSVWSETGCAVLIQWERPVKIIEES
jgi:anti-sigma factor ChrR (cupin superfamily)